MSNVIGEGREIKKRRLISIKGQTITKADYRGFLALILVSAFIYVAISGASCEAVAALGPLTGTAVTYYFHSKSLWEQNARDRQLVQQ